MSNGKNLPTDRRAEADTPPSAGQDAGLETVAKLQSSDIFWTDAGLKLPLPTAGEEIELVTRQSAAAALEAAAEREGAARFMAKHWEAQVADRDKRIAELEAIVALFAEAARERIRPDDPDGDKPAWATVRAYRQALSAIPAPGRSE